jgi:hypothetical protein
MICLSAHDGRGERGMDARQQLPPGVAVVDAGDVSIARLHGEACWHCGAVHTGLQPAGSVATPVEGGYRIWPVVDCLQHRGEAIS